MPARAILPTNIYLMTYNTIHSRYLFHPGTTAAEHAEYEQLWKYATAVASTETAVRVHSDGWVTNHGHTVLSDPLAQQPMFDKLRNNIIAVGQRNRLGLPSGGVFAKPGPSACQLLEHECVLDKMVYTMTQPIHHGLVNDLQDSPFVCTTTAEIGKTVEVERPLCLENDDGTSSFPPYAELRIWKPPVWEDMSDRKFRAILHTRIRRRVAAIQRKRERLQLPPPSLTAALAVHPEARPAISSDFDRLDVEFDSEDGLKSSASRRAPKSRLNPRVAGGTKEQRIAVLTAMLEFEAEHRAAFNRFRDGDRHVLFPRGTYQMKRHCGVRVAGAALSLTPAPLHD